jgi:eukaryotic-like serine/threonine-protein kinase
MLHRFQSERQSLAIMDHPSIAKVFDAGATPDGQPYFVMEYVPFADNELLRSEKLNIREHLGLFMQSCEGVQHAHQKAIVHRDLKPANVLVVEVDGNYIAQELKKPLCQCYARDLINQIFWAERYSGFEPRLTRDTVQQACRAYFLSTGKAEKLGN